MKPVDFDSLIGQTFRFYGVAGLMFKLDDVIFQAVKAETLGWKDYEDDPQVGFCLDKIVQIDPKSIPVDSWFFSLPLARVVVCREGSLYDVYGHHDLDFNGYSLVDVAQIDHEWLRLGTQSSCNFHFDYMPSEPLKTLLAIEDPVAKAAALAGYLLEQERLGE